MAFTSFVASTTISASDMNANMAFMQGDFVPFDTAGTVTTNAFNLGTTTGIWKSAYVNSLNVGSINCSNTAIFNVDSQFSSTVKISGNVSIGHNNASQTLDVKGRTWFIASTGTWANVMDNNGENGYGLLVRGLKSQNTIFQASSSDTSLFIINGNGNSGFGWNNINPSQTLDVSGNIRATGNLGLSNLGGKYLGSYSVYGGSLGNLGLMGSVTIPAGAILGYVYVAGDYYNDAVSVHDGYYEGTWQARSNRIQSLHDVNHSAGSNQGFTLTLSSGVLYINNKTSMSFSQSGNPTFIFYGD